MRLSTGVILFFATLIGSLLGAAADLNGAAEAFQSVQRLFYPELCIAGSNTILGDGIPMAALWGKEFEAQNNTRVRIEGVGSVRGVENAINGECVHVLTMSEPITETQHSALQDSGISLSCAAEIGYDVIAFVGDIDNDVSNILSRNLGNILNGRIKNWSELGGEDRPIQILARPGSGTTEFVLSNIARWDDPNIADNEYFPPNTHYTPCTSNNTCLDATLSTRGSLYWVSTAWMRTQPEEYLRVIPILRGDERAINPLSEDIDLDQYPSGLIRPLYMYVLSGETIPDNTEQTARNFLTYVRSVRGQQVLEEYQFYTFFARPTEVAVILPASFAPDENGITPVCQPS